MSQNQAAWLDGAGKQLRVGPAETPKVGPGKVLIRNRAVAVNPADWKIQDLGILKETFPSPLGFDIAGEVVEVGEGVERIHKGDRVAAWAFGDGFQLYYAANASETGVLPDNVSFAEGAVLPVSLVTSVVGLSSERPAGLGLPFASLDPKPSGKVIVVWGGSSSVGAGAIQFAVAGGTKVVAVASERNFGLLKEAGASEVFDYNSSSVVEDVVKAVKSSGLEFAGVYDSISVKESLEPVEKVIAALGGGISIVLLPGAPESTVAGVQRTLVHGKGPLPEPTWVDFFTEALRQGKLKPLPRPYVIGKGLESVQAGLDYVKKGVSAQKVVIEL